MLIDLGAIKVESAIKVQGAVKVQGAIEVEVEVEARSRHLSPSRQTLNRDNCASADCQLSLIAKSPHPAHMGNASSNIRYRGQNIDSANLAH
ncbi:uncharacterized protein MYCFIDRAFT_170287 [Pseudocercospora fijiensis CIRAD86]|uniref:Uncharacterized protein n=1 Tax=Pseudocercospora fijiensis (strain CIRAD86) TaxID=383855 RepID=N1QBS4_PSEFD|nr:uncharacterized protein MYCFIDRAFT_170287 [Pseudocercospora fijiensis CIRAD86]EME88702.1 hypothetical protein MYCFIDRAFT_170287 [Pseudocercospora fijiensis CIRAD86]